MGNSIHKIFVNLSPKTFFHFSGFCFHLSIMMINRNISIFDLSDQFLRLMDSVCHFCNQNFLSVKSCEIYILIRCNNDSIRFFYLLCSQHIFCTVCPLRFHFYRNPQFFSFCFKTFRCHKCMGDSGRACRNRQHFITGLLIHNCCFFLFFFTLASLFFIDDLQKFVYIFRTDQLLPECIIHQHGR